MRIINVITMSAGVIDNVHSFAIYEEQLSQEVVDKAEALFMEKAREFGFDEDEHEADILSDGWFESEYGSYPAVAIVWSDV